MAWPLRHLPVIQQWDCHGCVSCCRDYRVYVTDAERENIAGQDWSKETDLAGIPLVVQEGWWRKTRYRLNQRDDGCCVFLSEQGRCRIHERYGSEAKPFACRLYPFVLVPAADHWRVGLRFSCPSAARNQGRPLPEHAAELRELAGQLEQLSGAGRTTMAPPPLQGRQRVDWPDLWRFVQVLLSFLQDRRDRMERRLRKCLALAALCREASFDQVQGDRLAEFLAMVANSIDAEVPPDPASLPPPSWVGRVLFRQALAVLIRKDSGPERGPVTQRRLALLGAAWLFACGRGSVPALHGLLPQTTFAQLEEPAGPLGEAEEAVLERYYQIKVGALQFCGPANFGLSFWSGLEGLALTLPAILWLVRAFRDLPRQERVVRAVAMVDHNFGCSPHLGRALQRFGLRVVARRGEIEKLIGWYSR